MRAAWGLGYLHAGRSAPNGDLYAGGQITLEANRASFPMVARWDCRAWSRIGGFTDSENPCRSSGNAGEVYALAVTPTGDLYVGGIFSAVDGVRAHNLARWDGRTWHAVGSGLDGPVLALACASNNRLIVGGSFAAYSNNSAAASHFAVLDPTACQPMGKSESRDLGVGAKRVHARRPRPARGQVRL